MSRAHRLRRRLSPGMRRHAAVRREVAAAHLHGDGIEIGALHEPLPLPADAHVRYVDRTDLAGLRRHYPELADEDLVTPDIVDDGERLSTIADGTLDFVVANHFLEHTEDPLGTLFHLLRVLRRGGILFLALPDRGHGIDTRRVPPTWEHLLADHGDGGAAARPGHYREWAELVDGPLGNIENGDLDRHARALQERRYSIHFHAWNADEFAQVLARARSELALPGRTVEVRQNAHEFITVLERT